MQGRLLTFLQNKIICGIVWMKMWICFIDNKIILQLWPTAETWAICLLEMAGYYVDMIWSSVSQTAEQLSG